MITQAPAPLTAVAPRHPTRRSKALGLVAAAALLALMCIASLAIGTENVSLPTVWQSVTDYRDIGDQWISPFIVAGALLCLIVSRSLNITALGEDLAKSMGGNVVRTQVLSLIAVTLLAGAATAGAGPIGFVGLMVPHAVRRFTGPDWRWILGYAVLVGPALLLAADIIGRVVIPPAELPAGIVTAFVGAPLLIWLIRRRGADRA